jgi:serine/threonine protein kinase
VSEGLPSEAPATSRPEPRLVVGRYVLYDVIGGGGMATVHIGRMMGAAGFSRIVAIKRVHPALVDRAAEMTTMLVDEARLASRIAHPNVVTTLDVVDANRELLLVMEYVHGLSVSIVSALAAERGRRIPQPIAARIVLDMLAGLHAAHEAKSERGTWLEIVHRDVSPQNVVLGADGVSRIVDFGIAKAEGKLSLTREGQIKGKLGYMAPEQLRAQAVDRRTDVYAAGVVLWELLTGRRFFEQTSDDVLASLERALAAEVPAPSVAAADVPPALDDVVLRATRRERDDRFDSTEDMALALEAACVVAKSKDVAAFLEEVAGTRLEARTSLVANLEQWSSVLDCAAPAPNTETLIADTVPLPVADTIPLPRQPAPRRVGSTLPSTALPRIVTKPLPVAPRAATTRRVWPFVVALVLLVLVLVVVGYPSLRRALRGGGGRGKHRSDVLEVNDARRHC